MGLGAFFLLQQLVPALYWRQFWPVALVVLGLALIVTSSRRP